MRPVQRFGIGQSRINNSEFDLEFGDWLARLHPKKGIQYHAFVCGSRGCFKNQCPEYVRVVRHGVVWLAITKICSRGGRYGMNEEN